MNTKTDTQLIAEFLQHGGEVYYAEPGETAIDPNSGLSHKQLRNREVYSHEERLIQEALAQS